MYLPLVENKSILTQIPFLAARTRNLELLYSLVLKMTYGSAWSWNSNGITQELHERRYGLVVLSQGLDISSANIAPPYPRYPHFDSQVQTAISDNYGLCFQIGNAFVYGRLAAGKLLVLVVAQLSTSHIPTRYRYLQRPFCESGFRRDLPSSASFR